MSPPSSSEFYHSFVSRLVFVTCHCPVTSPKDVTPPTETSETKSDYPGRGVTSKVFEYRKGVEGRDPESYTRGGEDRTGRLRVGFKEVETFRSIDGKEKRD